MSDFEKPSCRLTGEDGNAYAIMGRVSSALKRAGLKDQAKEFQTKALACGSYDELLVLCMEYVENEVYEENEDDEEDEE